MNNGPNCVAKPSRNGGDSAPEVSILLNDDGAIQATSLFLRSGPLDPP
jgi:hypothetical protein